MSRWFRVDDGLVDDPKVQQLPDRLFRVVINLWCVTSQNGGKLPSIHQVAFKLRMTQQKAEKALDELRRIGLIDDDEDGTRPHNWNGRQFKSDVTDPTNAERQRRYRDRHNTVTDTVTVTPTRAETEQIREEKDIRSIATATRPADRFDEFWKAYPKRDGSNPKQPARKKFLAAVKSGVDPGAIIEAAKRFAEEARSKGNVGTPYVAQAMTWLSQQRWDDYARQSDGENGHAVSGFYAPALSKELEEWDEYRRSTEGKAYPRDVRGGWIVPAQWPPTHEVLP